MKTIQIEEDLYQYIASQTQDIGENASSILRRLLIERQEPIAQEELKPLNDAVQTQPINNDDVDGHEHSGSVEALKTADSVEQDSPSTLDEVGNVFDVLNKEEVMTQKGAVGRFLFILAAFQRCHSQTFRKVLEIKGRERSYFGETAQELEKSGSSIKPKAIPDSELWVITNTNTPRKKYIITKVASVLGYTTEQAEKIRELI